MMTGYVANAHYEAVSRPRLYVVVERGGGWSVSLNGACTRPFADRGAAERIARQLQRQADGLNPVDNGPLRRNVVAFDKGL